MARNYILIRLHEQMGLKESISACDTISNSSKICEFKKNNLQFPLSLQQSKRSFSKSRLEELIVEVEELEVATKVEDCVLILEALLEDDEDCLFVSPALLFMIWNKNELPFI